MHEEIREAFEQIHATEQMKQSVSRYLIQNRRKTAKRTHAFLLRPLVSACVILMVCIGVGNWYFFEMPVSYVSVDVNPSIELILNRRNRVTSAESRNKDGERVLKNVQLEGMDYLEAVELLVECEAMQDYLTKDAELTFTVASDNAEEILAGLQNSEVTAHYQGRCHSADLDTVTSAHQCGMSLGKYQIYQLLSEYGAGLTADDCKNIPMCHLRLLLAQYEDGKKGTVNYDEIKKLEVGCGHEGGGHHHPQNHH